jgi:hypothetical protein
MKVRLAAQRMNSSVAAAIDTHVTAGKENFFLKAALCEQSCHVIQFQFTVPLYNCK